MSVSPTGFDIKPGHTVTVQISADSTVVSQPGSYAAQLDAVANTPYPSLAPVGVSLFKAGLELGTAGTLVKF
jgi:hypothetical protein